MNDPRMSPLYISHWEKATEQEKTDLVRDLKPAPKLASGDSFQVRDDGSFLPLKPGDAVPEKPVRGPAR